MNSANTEQLGQYRKTTGRIGRVFSVLAEFFHIGRVCDRYDAG